MEKSLQKLKRAFVWFKYHLYFDDFSLFLFFCLILFLLMMAGCKSPKHTSTTIVRYIDSTVVLYRDSLITIEVPKERIVNIVALPDTLQMETSLATAKCWVDTTMSPNTLRGELENKPDAVLEKVVYLPSKERIVYRDSIQTKEVPVEVVKVKQRTPKWAWYAFGILGTLVVIGYRKYIAKCLKFLIALF